MGNSAEALKASVCQSDWIRCSKRARECKRQLQLKIPFQSSPSICSTSQPEQKGSGSMGAEDGNRGTRPEMKNIKLHGIASKSETLYLN